MQSGHSLTFGPFRLDVTQGQLWRGAQVLALRRRSLAMLRYLAERRGRLVTKAELRQHVWGGTHVTDTVLRVSVREIRAVLGDAADAPEYLATVGRQGYRFLVGDDREVAPRLLPGPLVGRQGEVDTLASWFQRAAQGARQFVLVSGEAGVGKTTVVDRWLAHLAAGRGVRIARGLWGLSQFQMTQGHGATAGEVAQQLLHLAQRQPDTGYLVEGHFVVGTVALNRGDFLAARTHLEQSWRLSVTWPSPTAILRGGFVPGVTARTSLAQVLWALGYADQAQQRCQEALALAQQGDHLPSLAYAECFVGLVCQCRQDVAATQVHADALLALAAAQSWPLRVEQGRILRGWALAMHGEAVAGVALLRQGLASPAVGPELLRPHWLALLAEAYGRAGRPEAGLQVLAEAVTRMTTTEMWWTEAEMSRLQGALRLQLASPEVPQAEACFLQAIAVARRQQAKAVELRAALSLSRLWQQQGRRHAACELLAPIYGWFTEGFDTADLQEAKTLLEELA